MRTASPTSRRWRDYEESGHIDSRFSTWWIQSTELGRLWVGKGDQATERITEINLANTNNFLKHYGRWNGSFRLRRADGSLSTTTWGHILPQSGFTGEGVPGEGDRLNVVKYDSPEFGGFVFSTAYGEDDLWDVALRYAGEQAGSNMQAASATDSTRVPARSTSAAAPSSMVRVASDAV